MKREFTTGSIVRAVGTDRLYRLLASPVSERVGGTERKPGLECYIGKGFYHAQELGVWGDWRTFDEDDIELAFRKGEGPFYVDMAGEIYTYTVSGNGKARLPNGEEIDDRSTQGFFFATVDSAYQMMRAILTTDSQASAIEAHKQWIKEYTNG